MDWPKFGRNMLFAVILLAVVASLTQTNLPFTNRAEEYVAYVLSTDFDYQRWLDQNEGILEGAGHWRQWLPWFGSGGAPAQAPLSTTDPPAALPKENAEPR